MGISVSENVSFLVESAGKESVITATFTKTDSIATDSEFGTVTIPASTTNQDLGSITPATLFGRIKTGKQIFLQTDAPCTIKINGGTESISLKDVLLINGDFTNIKVSTTATGVNLKVAIAGTLT